MLWKAPEAVVGLGGGRIWVSRVVVENMDIYPWACGGVWPFRINARLRVAGLTLEILVYTTPRRHVWELGL